MTWQVIAERPRGDVGWPGLESLFAAYRKKVEAGTHMMCTRYVERTNPDTWEPVMIEQRVVKECGEPLEPCHIWNKPQAVPDWLRSENRSKAGARRVVNGKA